MNPYVSANEKAQLIRVILMRDVLKDAIEVYEGLDSTDKAFLTELRHGKTRVEKAVKLRRLSLDNEADDKLIASAGKLHPMFVPTPEAKKINKELLELQSTLPMDIEDLQDWYGFMIEFTCKNCTKADYTECPARRVLTKYEICPMDPGAIDKCQYTYAAEVTVVDPAVPGKLIEKPEFAELGSVSFHEHYAVKKQIEDLQEKNAKYIERNQELYAEICKHEKFQAELMDIFYPDDCLDKSMSENIMTAVHEMDDCCKELNTQIIEQVKECNMLRDQLAALSGSEGSNKESTVYEDDSLPVFLGLNNGNKLEIFLPETMAKNLIAESQRPRLSRSICARYVDGEFVAIDLQEVVAMRVSGLTDADYIKTQHGQATSINERGRFRVECYCGNEYFADMYDGFREGRKKARCNGCGQEVYLDPKADKVIDPKDGVEAVLLTNRYSVNQEVQKNAPVIDTDIPSDSSELKAVPDLRTIKNVGRDYKDPCQLLG